jgi:drug/metabolite transporter (DMT)-like permease
MAELILHSIPFVLVLLASFCGAFALFLIKKGLIDIKVFSTKIFNIKILMGVSFYGLSIIIVLVAMKYLEYTIVIPLTSLTYVFSMFISHKYLGEKISIVNIIGIFIIFIASIILII